MVTFLLIYLQVMPTARSQLLPVWEEVVSVCHENSCQSHTIKHVLTQFSRLSSTYIQDKNQIFLIAASHVQEDDEAHRSCSHLLRHVGGFCSSQPAKRNTWTHWEKRIVRAFWTFAQHHSYSELPWDQHVLMERMEGNVWVETWNSRPQLKNGDVNWTKLGRSRSGVASPPFMIRSGERFISNSRISLTKAHHWPLKV